MYFKLDYVLRPIQIGDLDTLRLEFATEFGKVDLVIDKWESADPRLGALKGDYRCVATMERDEPVRTEIQFIAMGKNVLPGVQNLINDVRGELGRCIDSTIENIKWTRGIVWMHDRVRFGSGLKWSLDGAAWKQVPNEIHFEVEEGVPEPRFMNEGELVTIQTHVEAGIEEPLAHAILSEAYAQRTVHPRSSLVMGIAAAEVGWKQFVAERLQQTKWLVENLPSPPLEKMVKELMPLIPVRLKVQGKKTEIPESIVGQLRKGVNLRNKAVHSGDQHLTRVTLEDILLSVRDFLYLLDLYGVHSWALKNVRTETVKNMNPDQ